MPQRKKGEVWGAPLPVQEPVLDPAGADGGVYRGPWLREGVMGTPGCQGERALPQMRAVNLDWRQLIGKQGDVLPPKWLRHLHSGLAGSSHSIRAQRQVPHAHC